MSGEVDLGISGLSDYVEIGTGGFATVFAAWEDDAGRQVAVKVLDAVDEGGRRRFDRERRTLGLTTEHPNIVTMFRSGYTEPGQRPYLVMEHLAGGSLQDRLEGEGPVPTGEAIDIAKQVAAALGFGHSLGIVHRDVKPANILASTSGLMKLSDFGIAAVKESTQTSQVAYSIAYAPPESFEVARDPESGQVIDPRNEASDLYSLAATLYTLVTGSAPFQGGTHVALMRQILEESPAPSGTDELDRFLATAMAKDPAQRYPDAAAFITALDRLAMDESPPTTTPTSPTVMAAESSVMPEPTVAAPLPATVVVPATITPSRRGNRLVQLADGRLATAGGDGTVQLRDVANPHSTAVAYTGHINSVRSLVQLEDGRVASASFDATVHLWDPADTSVAQATYAGHTDSLWAVAILTDGRIASGGGDRTVRIWHPADPETTHVVYTGHNDSVLALAPLTDGRIASASADWTVRIWHPADPETTHVVYTGHHDSVLGLTQLLDGRIASAGFDGTVQIWDPARPNGPVTTADHHVDRVWAVEQLTDGRLASAGEDHTVQVWQPAMLGDNPIVYRGHTDAVWALLQLADGRIASASVDSTVRVWDLEDPGNRTAGER